MVVTSYHRTQKELLMPQSNKKYPKSKRNKKPSVKGKGRKRTILWKSLIHNGVLFPPDFKPHGLTLTINGKKIVLSPQQEEMAWAWASKRDTPYVQDKVFASNFLLDFLKMFPQEYSNTNIQDINFSRIIKYQEKEKERKSQPEVKKKLAAERKKLREALKDKYGFVEIDGYKTEIANYLVEPPGIFMGRGKHPLRGRWKPRIYPKDITLNLSKKGENPLLPEGQKWGKRIQDNQSMWLASWTDKLTKKNKYVWPHDSSNIRQQRDKMKFDYAKKLAPKLERIRKHIMRGMNSKDIKTRKIATVCYLIDKLCMRVGDEKDEDEADTVGASTLRIEHLQITPHNIKFNFLGKDSVPWSKSISGKAEKIKLFRKNLEIFMDGKKNGEIIFDGIRSSDINRFLGKTMDGLTAKVFRTFYATKVASTYLLQNSNCQEEPEFQKIFYAKMANLETAITCNHKRTPPKNWEKSIVKKKERLRKLRAKPPKTEKAQKRYGERLLKTKLSLQLAKKTKEYNLNTSLRNYIDPRIYKSWSDSMDLDWQKVYAKTLQKKFSWIAKSKIKWSSS